jgi:hypothetical protein
MNYLAKYNPIQMFLLTFRERLREHLGTCAVKGCEKEIWREKLVCSIGIGNNDYYVCLEHIRVDRKEIDITKYRKFPNLR